jgi:DNA-binding MarR family transcriptional regulator
MDAGPSDSERTLQFPPGNLKLKATPYRPNPYFSCYNPSMTLSELKTLIQYPLITTRQIAVLMLISQHKAHSFSQIALDLGLPKPALSRAVDALLRRRFIKRERSEAREMILSLTAAGVELLAKIST